MPHEHTIACVEKAEKLIREQSADAFRYATLQLRMGIEYLFYELVPLYKEELPENILTQWRPQQVLDAILDCDPNADQDSAIAFVPSGTLPNPDDFKITKAVSKRLLREYYHKLGSQLHASTDLQTLKLDKWKGLLSNTTDALRQYTSDQVIHNIGEFIEFQCECGQKIRRRVEVVLRKNVVQCFSPNCGMTLENVQLLDGKVSFRPRAALLKCKECQTDQYVPLHKLKDGVKVTCCHCHRQSVARAGFWLE